MVTGYGTFWRPYLIIIYNSTLQAYICSTHKHNSTLQAYFKHTHSTLQAYVCILNWVNIYTASSYTHFMIHVKFYIFLLSIFYKMHILENLRALFLQNGFSCFKVPLREICSYERCFLGFSKTSLRLFNLRHVPKRSLLQSRQKTNTTKSRAVFRW